MSLLFPNHKAKATPMTATATAKSCIGSVEAPLVGDGTGELLGVVTLGGGDVVVVALGLLLLLGGDVVLPAFEPPPFGGAMLLSQSCPLQFLSSGQTPSATFVSDASVHRALIKAQGLPYVRPFDPHWGKHSAVHGESGLQSSMATDDPKSDAVTATSAKP